MTTAAVHSFHIPVMGLAFTIDSPIKVAHFGISSVISIVEDRLIEMMRSHYYKQQGKAYLPIGTKEPDYRAKRITDYLNLVNKMVQEQFEKLKSSAFEAGAEIVQYFEMLPEESKLKQLYYQLGKTADPALKENLEQQLRSQMQPGSIDVNIMTKVDRDVVNKQGEPIADGSDAVTALRGYANSTLNHSSIIFSAGMNPRLYNYLEQCNEFYQKADGSFNKRIVIKVSDYRSALIQGKYLAKKGIWVSEFRIESGLNCGGHAFASEGFLMGPVLEEFKTKRQELMDALYEIYVPALQRKNMAFPANPPAISISAQGGIGTYEEDKLLRQYYGLQSTGWGTPFLLVPEATTVDEHTLQLLCNAKAKDVVLSKNSPLGVRFYYLKGTSSDIEKQRRIDAGKPGSPCTEKHLAFNTEFTKEPICTASQKYQRLKIAQLQSLNLPAATYKRQEQEVLDKECLCVSLCNAAPISYEHPFLKTQTAVSICPGPNIENFSKTVSLKTMVDHIYGRANVVTNPQRPHLFIAELNLYIQFMKNEMEQDRLNNQMEQRKKYYHNFIQNLQAGIQYYKSIEAKINGSNFAEALEKVKNKLKEVTEGSL